MLPAVLTWMRCTVYGDPLLTAVSTPLLSHCSGSTKASAPDTNPFRSKRFMAGLSVCAISLMLGRALSGQLVPWSYKCPRVLSTDRLAPAALYWLPSTLKMPMALDRSRNCGMELLPYDTLGTTLVMLVWSALKTWPITIRLRYCASVKAVVCDTTAPAASMATNRSELPGGKACAVCSSHATVVYGVLSLVMAPVPAAMVYWDGDAIERTPPVRIPVLPPAAVVAPLLPPPVPPLNAAKSQSGEIDPACTLISKPYCVLLMVPG